MTRHPIHYRTPNSKDIPFIYSTWLKSYRNSDIAKNLSNDTYYHHHRNIVNEILTKDNVAITVICDETDHDQIYGYVVAEILAGSFIIHYVYVKYNFRKLKLLSQLYAEKLHAEGYLPQDRVTFVTHLPRNYQTLKSLYNIEYNPYLLQDLKC